MLPYNAKSDFLKDENYQNFKFSFSAVDGPVARIRDQRKFGKQHWAAAVVTGPLQ